MSSNMPASLANGRYQLGQLVGRGGMAEVRVALDTRLGRTVAIKIMRADLANDKIFLSRFRREAHSVAQMNNPNIVNIYDSGEETVMTDSGGTERLPYLVMEFVKGRQIISRNHCAVFSECVGERRHRALRQSAVADEFRVYSERRGDGEQEAQSRSALAAVEDAAVMQLVKTAEGCARVLGGAERFGIFFACERHGCHQPVRVRL